MTLGLPFPHFVYILTKQNNTLISPRKAIHFFVAHQIGSSGYEKEREREIEIEDAPFVVRFQVATIYLAVQTLILLPSLTFDFSFGFGFNFMFALKPSPDCSKKAVSATIWNPKRGQIRAKCHSFEHETHLRLAGLLGAS